MILHLEYSVQVSAPNLGKNIFAIAEVKDHWSFVFQRLMGRMWGVELVHE